MEKNTFWVGAKRVTIYNEYHINNNPEIADALLN
jgi:hypothetical protein